MLRVLYRASAAWVAAGLASGLFYREFTKMNNVAGGTQLATVHTHALVLGTVFTLVLLALAAQFRSLLSDRQFRTGFLIWQIGLVITIGCMIAKGCLQVLGSPAATSPAIAGVAGLGHMTLTAAFAVLFLALGRAVRDDGGFPEGSPAARAVS